ncbi:MAG: metal-dependent hydrolase [Bacteroidetes bacterium]|nr:metal-dependent hydrolase [Bacteroidota bacterium]
MASAFSHAIAAVAIGKATFIKRVDWKFWLLGMFCAVIPDADAIGFKLGIPYESVWGHRGITHSFFFAALLAVTVNFLFYKDVKPNTGRWWGLFAFFFLSTASHPILDAMTTGGLGVAFFAPFHNERYFFSYRPIQVSPIGVAKFFSEWGLRVIKSELVWVWLPSLVVIAIVEVYKKMIKS